MNFEKINLEKVKTSDSDDKSKPKEGSGEIHQVADDNKKIEYEYDEENEYAWA